MNPARLVVTLMLAALPAGGCGPGPRPVADAGPDEQYEISADTPAAAARSALLVMRAELKATARQDRKAAAAHLAALRQGLVATDVLTAEIRRMPHVARLGLSDPDVAEIARQVTETWSAIIAHYVDGLDFASMSATESEARSATVLVPARGRDSDALIRVRCVQAGDGSWRVARVDFVPRRSAATQPSEMSAPTGG